MVDKSRRRSRASDEDDLLDEHDYADDAEAEEDYDDKLDEEDYDAAVDGAYDEDDAIEDEPDEDYVGTDELDTLQDDGALVFGEAPAEAEAGQTFVGELPVESSEPAAGEKTEILSAATGGHDEFPILTIETADGTSDVEVVKQTFVIGRSPECDVVLPDQLVSRQHSILEHRPDGWYLVDQNSGNGTFLNEQRVKEELLYDGDLIEIGDAAITFTAPGSLPDVGGGAPASADKTQMLPASAIESAPGSHMTGAIYMPGAGGGKKKKLLLVGAVVVLLIAAAVVIKFVVLGPPAPTGPTPEQIAAERAQQARVADATAKFEKVKELAKEEKWLEAMPLIRDVAEVLDKNENVEKYKKTIQHEAAVASHIQEARDKMEAKDYVAALKALSSVQPDSMQIETVNQLKTEVEEARRAFQQEQARLALSEDKFEEALELAMSMLQVNPSDDVAAEIKDQAEKGIKKRDHRTRRPITKKKTTTRPVRVKNQFLLVGESLVSYRNANLDQAESLAASSGVGENGIKELKKFKSLYTSGTEMSRNAGQAAKAIQYLEKAFSLDKKLGGGKGKINDNIRSRLAKVFFVMGVDAHTRKKFDLAFKSYTSALKYKQLDSAQDRLRKLEMEAKKLYETAYVIKGSAPEKAVTHCKTVLTMVASRSIYFGKCKKLIGKIQGPLGGGDTGGDDGF